ncbi:hypothetical protein [Streptomyces melanogenes]|uniref:hypothetical protein n=1 Tax=Streptomyces melanogenes TaxID=67326 RepID=UPI00379F8564
MDDEPITELRPVAFPQVFGYLCDPTDNPSGREALAICLTEYCTRHELALRGVFTDREWTATVHSRAFIGLLHAIELPGTYGVVVPAPSHLGPQRIATERRRRITATGARLIVVRTARPTRDAGRLRRGDM